MMNIISLHLEAIMINYVNRCIFFYFIQIFHLKELSNDD